jgi:hypothetical protein
MEKAQRSKYKTLANDAVIATFGQDGLAAQLATALESCVDELESVAAECAHCKTCESHGDFDDDSIPVEANEVMDAHRELTGDLKALEAYRDKLIDRDGDNNLLEELTELIEDFRNDIDSVEACVVT